MTGVNLAWDRITPTIYVSTGAVHYQGEQWGERYQIETCIFSTDPTLAAFTQRIHGSVSSLPAPWLEEKAKRVHGHVVRNLRERFK